MLQHDIDKSFHHSGVENYARLLHGSGFCCKDLIQCFAHLILSKSCIHVGILQEKVAGPFIGGHRDISDTVARDKVQ